VKQVEDVKTGDIFEQPKRRGRPASGKAKSNAERQRLYRIRQSVKGDNMGGAVDSVWVAFLALSDEDRKAIPAKLRRALYELGRYRS
jgi:hypothetical protein